MVSETPSSEAFLFKPRASLSWTLLHRLARKEPLHLPTLTPSQGSKMQVTLKMTQCRLLDVHRRTASVALALRVVSRMFAWCWLCRALVFLLHVIEMAPFPFLMVTVFSFHMAFSYSRELPVPPCQMAATSSSTRLSFISLQSRLMKVSL